ncbi:MAG: hypothetical protein ACR2FQ_04005 [Pseudonocardiaceae bacterium]
MTDDHGREVTAVDARAVLARYRRGVMGETARTVHVVPHLGPLTAGAVSALCGALLGVGQIETVTAGVGMPCTMCLLLRTHSAPKQLPAASGGPRPHGIDRGNPSVAAVTRYRTLWAGR